MGTRAGQDHAHGQYSPKGHGHPGITSSLRELAERFVNHLRDHASGAGATSTAAVVAVPDIAPSDTATIPVRLPAVMPDGYLATALLAGQTAAIAGGRIVGWQTTTPRRVDVLVRNAGSTVLTGASLLVTATVPQPTDVPEQTTGQGTASARS